MKYRSRKEYRSRLAQQESKRFTRQTILIIGITIVLLLALLFLGIPALIKLAIIIGDFQGSSTPVEQNDTIPPATPQLITPIEATKSATLRLSGYSEAGATVALFHNDEQLTETIVDNQGMFEFSDIALDEGENRFYTIATDLAGNKSQRSSQQVVLYDTKNPDLEITKPSDSQQFFGLSEQNITIEGKTEPDAQVTLNDLHLVVDSAGNFRGRLQLNEGDNDLHFVASDTAGNQTEKTIKVKYTK